MINPEDYGCDLAGVVGDCSFDRFSTILRQAVDDPYFGLPTWARNVTPEQFGEKRFWIFGTTEFSSALYDALGCAQCAGFVDDHKVGQTFRGQSCFSSGQFLEKFALDTSSPCLSGARYDTATRYFRGLAKLAGARMLNFEQSIRALRPQNVDCRLADHSPYILANVEHYLTLHDRFHDELSKETFRRVVLFHLTTCREFYRHIERPYETLYFRSGIFEVTDREAFVDCGASIGESISNLLTISQFEFERAWLIEPDKFNVETLRSLCQRFDLVPGGMRGRIRLVPAAVGRETGRIGFRHAGGHGGNVIAGSYSEECADEGMVNLVRIDDVLEIAPTFIKMDIEGAELDALHGAASTIRAHRPKLAISAYHRASDLIEITKFVLSIQPSYKVGLRHHTPLRWDTCLYFH